MATDPSSAASPNFLISAADYIKDYMKETGSGAQAVKDAAETKQPVALPDFELIGRKSDLADISSVLLTKGKKNNLILTGQSGVGLSSLIMGLQASKTDPSTPLAMVEKNFFYLDIDALFSCESDKEIKDGFQKAMDTLTTLTSQGKDVVLVIENTKDFMNGVIDNRVTSMISKIMEATQKNPHFQTIFAATDQERPALDKSHAGFRKFFTLKDVGEPPKDELRLIVEAAAKDMGKQYDVTVSQEAIDSVLELTDKFPLPDLPAQPMRSLIVLEGAITSHLLTAQTKPAGLDDLKKTLDIVTIALATGKPAEGDLADRTPDELEGIRQDTDATIKRVEEEWKGRQDEIAGLYQKIMRDIKNIQEDNDKITAAKEAEKAKMAFKEEADEQFRAARDEYQAEKDKGDDADNKETLRDLQRALNKIGQDYQMKTGEDFVEPDQSQDPKAKASKDFSTDLSAWSSGEVKEAEDDREKYEEDLIEKKARYKELMANADGTPPKLTDDDVLAEFSRLSNVPMNKLQEDEIEKLLNLAPDLKKRVFGQDETIDALADAVITAKAGLKKPNAPIANFLFLGASGTGKTELSKALAELLFGDEEALEAFRMENYKQETSINTLLGSPQGFQGYEQGGKLVNTVRRKPYSVLLFDELEKAYPDIFDTFLAMCDEGVVEDTRGLKAYFGNIVNIFTSNFGEQYFLDPTLTHEQAAEKAMNDLRTAINPKTGALLFKPAFLNRLTIFCFNILGEPEIIQIADKNLKELNEQAADKGVSVDMPEAEVKKMCKQQYDPFEGGRGIRNYIQNILKPFVAKAIFRNKNVPGVVQIGYTLGEIDDKAKERIKAEVEAETEDNSEAGVKAQFEAVSKGGSMNSKQAEEKIKGRIEAAERKTAEISAEFIPADAPKPAAPVAANSNTATTAAKPALAN